MCWIAMLFLQTLQSYGLAIEPERITIKDLKSLLDSKADVVIVDVRSVSSYDAGHIPKAISMPFSDGIKARNNELPKDKLIILYCS